MKFLKNMAVTLLVLLITGAIVTVVWNAILPDDWLPELQKMAKELKEPKIDGGEYKDFNSAYCLYYGFLSEEGKEVYAQVYANAMAYQDSFAPVTEVTVEEVENIVAAVSYDHPELFWMDNSFSYEYIGDDICVRVQLEFNETINDIEHARERFERVSKEIVDEASKLDTDYEKEKYVYQFLRDTTEYDEHAEVNQSAYSAIVNGKSVCAGYARAFQYLMTQLKVPTYYCAGTSDGHAWNIIKLEQSYFNVDVTQEKYFNCPDVALSSNYRRSGYSVLLPKCTKAEYKKDGVK